MHLFKIHATVFAKYGEVIYGLIYLTTYCIVINKFFIVKKLFF
jgi:hypothetical protein